MDHVFGPVNSRRLGRSLGIDLFTEKICTLNCIYCEVGPTRKLTCRRDEYVPTAEILAELKEYFSDSARLGEIDFVTVTASGEPTLHAGFGSILDWLHEKTGKPIAVLTNGTTLDDDEVCRELMVADVVIPSLDAALERSFRKIDRPAPCLDLKRVIEGLVRFSRQYRGRLWLEILFAEGINDTMEDLEALQKVIGRMQVERIQLNTVARPPLEKFARPLHRQRLVEIEAWFRGCNPGLVVEMLARGASTEDDRAEGSQSPQHGEVLANIVQMLKRRPCTAADINKVFHCGGPEKVERYLAPLVDSGEIRTRMHGDRLYYLY